MPKIIEREVGKIVHRQKVKTFGDKVKEFLEGLAGFIIIMAIIGVFIGG
ncbi:hypothetical protein [Ruegeria sp. HKCCA0370]|nr:hypothetical protein [Ruegeria sp. HKCCA0370]